MKKDIVKSIIFGIIKTVLVYIWWAAMLFLATVFLMNIWKIGWVDVLKLAGVLTAFTVIAYVVYKIAASSAKRKKLSE